MKWPWQKDEPQGDENVDRFDEPVDDEQTPLFGDDDATGDEEEVSEETQTYAERIAQERETALLAKVRASLQGQGLDWTGEGAAIRDVNQFAAKFGFGGDPQQPQGATPATATDPYEALGERPDPIYDEDGARAWDQRYRAAIKAEAVAEMAPQLQQMQAMLAQTQVENATTRAQQYLQERGLTQLSDHPDFAAEFGQALLQQPMNTWNDPAVLTGIAGWVIPRLKPVERTERPRDNSGRYAAEDANQRSLRQVGAPRKSGRVPGEAVADASTRAIAAANGITPAQVLHYKAMETEEEHRDWERQRSRSGRR